METIDRWRERRAARDRARGYSLNAKGITVAIIVDFVIIGTSLWGNWLLSDQYSHATASLFWMGMLAPFAYAAIELGRVPLALLARTQPSGWVKFCCAIGTVMAMLVTVKTLSQLGEMMFRPRLFDVVHAQEAQKLAQANRDTLAHRIADARQVTDDAEKRYADTQSTDRTLNEQTKNVPKDNCYATHWADRQGIEHQGRGCDRNTVREEWLRKQKESSDRVATAKHDADVAQTALAALDIRPADTALAQANDAYREAVLQSQLHSFTAMVFGIAPSEVTDAQLHWFLRIFVFLPAFCAGIVATFTALAAVRHLPPKRDPVDAEGLGYLGAGIYAEAMANTKADLSRMIETAIREHAHV